MKKINFAVLVSFFVSTVLFALGMCMVLVDTFGDFKVGVILGVTGLVIALVTVILRRKAENKPPVKVSVKTAFAVEESVRFYCPTRTAVTFVSGERQK